MTTQDKRWIDDPVEGRDILRGTVYKRTGHSERWFFPEVGVMIDAVPHFRNAWNPDADYCEVSAYVLQDDGIYYPISEPAKNGWRTKRVEASPDPRAIVAAGLNLLT